MLEKFQLHIQYYTFYNDYLNYYLYTVTTSTLQTTPTSKVTHPISKPNLFFEYSPESTNYRYYQTSMNALSNPRFLNASTLTCFLAGKTHSIENTNLKQKLSQLPSDNFKKKTPTTKKRCTQMVSLIFLLIEFFIGHIQI